MEKLTQEYIDEYLAKEGWVNKSIYKNSSTKMEFICPKGHTIFIIWNSFQRGTRCSICSGNKKHTIEEVMKLCNNIGYKCLSKEYKTIDDKLKLICKNGHNCEISFKKLKNGINCSECSGNRRKDINYIKEYALKYNYICLSNEYKNNRTKLEFRCENNHLFIMDWHSFRSGYRCKECYLNNYTGENHPNWNPNKIISNTLLRKTRQKQWIIKHMKDDQLYDDFLLNPKLYSLDHIIPVFAFWEFLLEKELSSDVNILNYFRNNIVNNIENLQLMLKEDNRKKHHKYDKNDLYQYLEKFDDIKGKYL